MEKSKLSNHKRNTMVGLALLVLAGITVTANAQSAWPNMAVRSVVPYAPGGANDSLARVVAEK